MTLLLSTAADLYWLGRYLSRSQELVDLLLTCLQDASVESLGIPLSITGTWQSFYQQHNNLTAEALASFFITSTNPTSLSACLDATRADAQATRGRISAELWVAINSAWLEWQERAKQSSGFDEHLASYKWLKASLQAIVALVDSSLDGSVQHFIRTGQLIESLDHTLRKLATPDTHLQANADLEQWATALWQELNQLSPAVWHQAQNAGSELLTVCQSLPEHGQDMASVQEAQATLQRLTYGLADVFAS